MIDVNDNELKPIIETPEVEPYTHLLVNIENHALAYFVKLSMDDMEERVTEWRIAYRSDDTIDIDFGRSDGVFHIPARKVWYKRITTQEYEGMVNASQSAQARARLGGALR